MQHFTLCSTQKAFSLFLFFFLLLLGTVQAQDESYTDNREKYQIKIQRTSSPIKIDGKLDEAVWQSADKASDFWVRYPNTKPHAKPPTEAQLTYDDKFIYVAFTCYDTDKYIVQTLKRDQDYWDGDAIAVLLDPMGQSSNGFMFGVSPYGVQMEGLLIGGGQGDLDRNWDNKWFSAVQNYDDRWTVEMAIPFKTLRFDDTRTEWAVNFIRNNIKDNEYHIWTPIPPPFNGIHLNYFGSLLWDASPDKVKSNFSVIPYITGGVNHNIEDGEKVKGTFNAGLDAKVAVTSSLNLDLTINPDFSQIEVDQQVTNLSRFSIFLPEKRTFFLENADIFQAFGIPPIRPFFSRTVGLNPDGATVPILFGARLSGNLDNKTRIGIMNMQTKGDDVQTGQNYGTVAVHRRIGKRSLVKGLFSNRQGYTDGEFAKSDYGRNGGVEFELSSEDGTWTAWGGLHKSFKPDVSKKDLMYTYGVGYTKPTFNVFTSTVHVNENYFADMGFVTRIESFYRDTTIRRGFIQNFTQAEYQIFPKNDDVVNLHTFGWENFLVYFEDGNLSERFIRWRYFINMKNRSDLRFRLDNEKTNLLEELTFTEEDTVKAGIYNTYQFNIQYVSDQRKTFNYEVNFRHGGFYHGTLSSYEFGVNYRRQPWGNFSVSLQKNDIRFPNFEPIEFIDLNSRFEVSFSKNIFWTTFTQYNFQNNQFNINSRLQYRFSPMSDFFVVYTDNYGILDQQNLGFFDSIKAKNRALVFKLNYWFSL